MQNTNGLCCSCKNLKYKWLLQEKGSQIQINNKTVIEFGSLWIWGIYLGLRLCYLPQPSASADNTNPCLNNSSYPTRPHSIIVYYFFQCNRVKGIVSSPERCDFTSSQQYINNVLWSLFIMFWDQNSNYFSKFIYIENWVLITETFMI